MDSDRSARLSRFDPTEVSGGIHRLRRSLGIPPVHPHPSRAARSLFHFLSLNPPPLPRCTEATRSLDSGRLRGVPGAGLRRQTAHAAVAAGSPERPLVCLRGPAPGKPPPLTRPSDHVRIFQSHLLSPPPTPSHTHTHHPPCPHSPVPAVASSPRHSVSDPPAAGPHGECLVC